jgi:hypothetical protein
MGMITAVCLSFFASLIIGALLQAFEISDKKQLKRFQELSGHKEPFNFGSNTSQPLTPSADPLLTRYLRRHNRDTSLRAYQSQHVARLP